MPSTRRTGVPFTGQPTWGTQKWFVSWWIMGRSSTVGTNRYNPHPTPYPNERGEHWGNLEFDQVFLDYMFFCFFP